MDLRAASTEPIIAIKTGKSESSVIRIPQISAISSRSFWERLPFFLIASLLSATAIAKAWMLLTDPFADLRVGISREILWISVAFELWLAFENWRIRDPRVLTLLDSITFTAFAIFAGTRWAFGYTSCGCSGNVELPPWVFLMLDCGIVAWFVSSLGRRSDLNAGARPQSSVRSNGKWACFLNGGVRSVSGAGTAVGVSNCNCCMGLRFRG